MSWITPRTLKGFRDLMPAEALKRSALLRTAEDVFRAHGINKEARCFMIPGLLPARLAPAIPPRQAWPGPGRFRARVPVPPPAPASR